MNATPPEVRKHLASGLRTQRVTGPAANLYHSHTVQLPPCCPVSGNPLSGSYFSVSYVSDGWCLEVYSLKRVIREGFVGGFLGNKYYPPERNMEGMVALLGQMCADALGLRVRFGANLELDAGHMRIRGKAVPCASI